MAGGKRAHRTDKRDEELVDRNAASSLAARGDQSLYDHVESLQQSYGNRAVTTMIQREKHHRSKAASTDNPAFAGKAPAAPDFFPKDHVSKSLAARDDGFLEYLAGLQRKAGQNERAVKLYEELIYRHPRDKGKAHEYAIALHMAYGSIDRAKSLYWKQVAMGQIVPEEMKSNAQLIQEQEQEEAQSHAF